jgi:signal transduction histidine kinase/HAMP domain-containing protein
LILVQPIKLEGEEIGTICLESDLNPMYTRLQHGIAVIAGIFVISSLAAYTVSARLQGVISSPILYLAGVANFVSEKKQYAVRAEQHSTDEVGLLIQAFNEMLEQIQQRDSALVQANEQLEARVQERTAEITKTNEKLTREIVFRKKAEQILKQRTERIIHHQRTLVKLSKYTNKDLPSTIQRTTEEAAKTLSVERVGVWLLDENTDEFVCQDLYRQSQNSHEDGLRIKVADRPSYFQAIESSRIVAANKARKDPRTREFAKSYLEPSGITSLLDVPIRLHGKTLGVLSHEHTGSPREWSLEEQDFTASIADMISLQIEANERQKAERALAKANEHLADIVRELRRSNKELQDFAYVTAHDLKAPLRGIGTLTDWITTDYADKFDDTGRQQLHLLKGRVSRMSELIDSILHYSEIGRTARRIEPVDLNVLIPDVIGQLDPPEHVQITVAPNLPTVVSEKVRLIQLFQNLIGNAIKYMDKPQGLIEVDYASQDEYWRFSVTDNGPGIDEKYFTKIFEMFQTLTRRDELESTGIGLAVVKKIVDLCGGSVWVESKVGEGTTFYFTLPKQHAATEEAALVSSEANVS